MPRRPTFNPYRFFCDHCPFRTTCQGALKRHVRIAHRAHEYIVPPPNHAPVDADLAPNLTDDHGAHFGSFSDSTAAGNDAPNANAEDEGPSISYKVSHQELNGVPCNEDGVSLAPGSVPSPRTSESGWLPFRHRAEFELAEWAYKQEQLSANGVNTLLEIIGALLVPHGDTPPFASAADLHATIDAIRAGDIAWQSFSTRFIGELPPGTPPSWMTAKYEVHFRDPHEVVRQLLDNPSFASGFDPAPHRDFDEHEERVYSDFMSANWAWRQADELAKDATNKGAMVVPIILGSDKTTVSVATGQNDFYPLYLSVGNISNALRRSHQGAVVLIGFLAIPKGERKYDNNAAFASFRRQLFHRSLSFILQSLRTGATEPQILRCPDGHFRRALYCLGPYIADYPEQVLLTGIVQGWCPKCLASKKDLDSGDSPCRTRGLDDLLVRTLSSAALYEEFGIHGDTVPFTNDFPRADIHEMLSPDLLHQVIKGTFKDHLVAWVGEYIKIAHRGSEAAMNAVLDEIDRRIAATPPFPGLRHFHDGRRFKQWTGDDSKALMKVYLPAIAGLVPDEVVKTVAALLDFCYLVRRSVITQETLRQIDEALERFHRHRQIFVTSGVRTSFSLPRQHSLKHYHHLIEEYGAPNGLCSSITESKHIKAVKEPWRRSNRYNALRQMLVTNQRLDKLAAARADFKERGMMHGDVLSDALAARLQVLSESLEPPTTSQAAVAIHSHRPGATDRISVPDAALSNTTSSSSTSPTTADDVEVIEGPRVIGTVDMAQTPQRAPYPRSLKALGDHVGCPGFIGLVRQFLADQDVVSQLETSEHEAHEEDSLPDVDPDTDVYSYHSARATFYSPSDPSGIGGMRAEYIRSVPSWRGEERRDCAFAVKNPSLSGMPGLHVVRIKLLFSFAHSAKKFPCALVEWFSLVGDSRDEATGLWVVEPDLLRDGRREISIIHLDSVVRSAHLIPVFGPEYLPPHFPFSRSLDSFRAYYVNQYADHHAHELLYVHES